MTALHRIEQAFVMDTDDIPGRGGYAVVGMSDGVEQAERVFVAQNFGISDFLHDPQNQRNFHSFFRVPGGRRALVRRFARGTRRNQTQNSLVVHTLFIDDALFDALRGLPWLLIEALKDDVPSLVIDAPLPPLETNVDDNLVAGLAQRLTKRRDVIDQRLGAFAVPSVLSALSEQRDVALPQGVFFEQLTLLAWSMLPRPDRESMAWTQHDAKNIAGIDFRIANVAEGGTAPIDAAVHPVAKRLAAIATSSEEERDELDFRTASYGLTIRASSAIASWLDWRDALWAVRNDIHKGEEILLASLKRLANTARVRHKDPWINGEEVLEILWNNIPAEIDRGETPLEAVQRWAHLLRDSGLNAIIFREPPEVHWLDRAASDARIGEDLLVRFFLSGTAEEPAAAPVRETIARWLLARRGGNAAGSVIALLAVRLALDHSATYKELLELLLSTDDGLAAALGINLHRAGLGDFAFDAAEIAIRERRKLASTLIANVLVPHLEETPRLARRITAEFASEVASVMRAKPESWGRFAAHLAPDVEAEINETIAKWMFADPKATSGLARAVLPRVVASWGAEKAAPLAFELAGAYEPADVWFGVLLERAAALDTRVDRLAAQEFRSDIARLARLKLRLDGALDLLVRLLEGAAASELRVGESVRALILLLRPAWKENSGALISAAASLVRQTKLATGWEPVVRAMVEDFGKSQPLRRALSSLVSEYWLTVDPLQVPQLEAPIIDAIAILDERRQHRLAAEWRTRLRRLPESRSSARLISVLFTEITRQNRIAFREREIDQRKSTHETLNGLDCDYAATPNEYVRAISDAIVRHVAQHDPVRRISKYFDLLDAPDVSQTVKRIIETVLLPKAFHELKPAQWLEVSPDCTRAFTRGVPTMSFGYEAGLAGPAEVQRAFESACRANGRRDGIQALREGQRRRGVLQWALRKFGREQPLVAQR